MTDEVIVLTDPARELAELCESLHSSSGSAGETYLAMKFGVEPWSREFFQIVFTIIERCALVKRLVADLDIDPDYQQEILGHIDMIMSAFSADSMKNAWANFGVGRVSQINIGPVKAVSGLVRQKVAYRKLSSSEVVELAVEVKTLISWLENHQLSEQDFIRQGLIEGLRSLEFRLDKLQWLGWGYTLDSLREVIAAYMLLERGGVDPNSNPDAAAVLQKVGAVIKSVYGKVQTAQSMTKSADWIARAYTAGSMIYAGKPVVAALIGGH